MPVLWIPPALHGKKIPSPPVQIPAPINDIVIDGPVGKADLEHEIVTYDKGVKVTFGPTVITADRLEVHSAIGESYAIAQGSVVLDDPEGRVTADRIVFHWKLKSGQADQVYVVSGGFRLHADHLDIQPESHQTVKDKSGNLHDELLPPRWTLTNVRGTGCARPRPVYEIRSSKVIIEPGRQGTATRPVIYILGNRLIQLPTQRFSLDRRQQGIGYPTPSLDRDHRFGLAWGGSQLLNDSTSFSFNARTFQSKYPSGRISLSKSFVPPEKNPNPIVPNSEFSERFRFGYFDSIRTQSFESEELSARLPKYTIGAASYLHVSPSARRDTTYFDVPLEITAERTVSLHRWGLQTQFRATSLNEIREKEHERLSTQVSLLPPRINLGRRIYGVSRLDGSSFYGSNGLFGWARIQAGLLAEPTKKVSLGAIYFNSADAGRAEFDMDPLAFKEGIHARADINLGTTRLAYLVKYDFREGAVYDREYMISQVFGCIQAELTYRRFPSQYALTFFLTANDFFDRLSRRTVERTKPFLSPAVISDTKNP